MNAGIRKDPWESLKTQLKSLFNYMNCPYLQSESAVEVQKQNVIYACDLEYSSGHH